MQGIGAGDRVIVWMVAQRGVPAQTFTAGQIRLVRESMVTGQGEAIRRKPDLMVRWF